MTGIVPTHRRTPKASLTIALEALQRGAAPDCRRSETPTGLKLPSPRSACGLQDGWVKLLARWNWDLYCTFTLRDPLPQEAIDKRYRLLISQARFDPIKSSEAVSRYLAKYVAKDGEPFRFLSERFTVRPTDRH